MTLAALTIVVDEDLAVVDANDAAVELFGVDSVDELLGSETIRRLVVGVDKEEWDRTATYLRGHSTPTPMIDRTVVTASGRHIPVQMWSDPVDVDGRLGRLMAFRPILDVPAVERRSMDPRRITAAEGRVEDLETRVRRLTSELEQHSAAFTSRGDQWEAHQADAKEQADRVYILVKRLAYALVAALVSWVPVLDAPDDQVVKVRDLKPIAAQMLALGEQAKDVLIVAALAPEPS